MYPSLESDSVGHILGLSVCRDITSTKEACYHLDLRVIWNIFVNNAAYHSYVEGGDVELAKSSRSIACFEYVQNV